MDTHSIRRRNQLNFVRTTIFLVLFILLTIIVRTVDVQPIGVQQSCIGLATINTYCFNHFGVNMNWYMITDWLGLFALMIAGGFALLGLIQLISRKKISYVDPDLLLLGLFYLIVLACYALFETLVINYRPIAVHESLEASFPSSHTMIILFIMATAMMQSGKLIDHKVIKIAVNSVSIVIITVTIIGRMLSGVHWLTDILGGILLGTTLVLFYHAMRQYMNGADRPSPSGSGELYG